MVKTTYLVALPLVALVIVSGFAAVYYYSRYNQAESQNETYLQQLKALDVSYDSHILIDFGNGTNVWYNDTHFQPGLNLYVATQVITGGQVNATYYPSYSEHFVTAIYNVANSGNNYWGIWTYNSTASWQMANVGADDLQIYNGSVYAWFYGPNTSPP